MEYRLTKQVDATHGDGVLACMKSMVAVAGVLLVILSLVSGCCCVDLGYVLGPSYSLNDEDLLPFEAMYEIDRASRCLDPIDQSADVRIERDPSGSRGYDVMLHLYGANVSRTVAFAWENGRYKWIGEQEIHPSGLNYSTVDGEAEERIVVNYHEREFFGSGPPGQRIMYFGRDPNIPLSLTCGQARAHISKWESEGASP